MKLIVGLGNPGEKHVNERHNVGFWILNKFAADHGMTFQKKAFQGVIAKGKKGDHEVLLLKPETYMNLSGESVREAKNFYKLSADDILVVHDELDLETGVFRFATNRGDGGHNGVASIIEALGTKTFLRLRFGIGRPSQGKEAADFVLSPFSPEERKEMEKKIKHASEALALFLEKGLAHVQQMYHS